MVKPLGWPADLPAPQDPEFAERVVGWLLDRGPAELRSSALRTQPVALAYVIASHTEATLVGARSAYARLRTDLGGVLEPAQIDLAMQALEAEGARLLQVRREVDLVAEACLAGRAVGSADPA
jgi:hypothetical protein